MDQEFRITITADRDDAVISVVGPSLDRFNEETAGASGHQRLCRALRGPDGSVAGGLIGSTYWGWLYISLLWIREDLRGRGYGHRLLDLAEEEALRRGATNAYLDTFSFQAPRFYEKRGYRVFGELRGFPPGHDRYFLTKTLKAG